MPWWFLALLVARDLAILIGYATVRGRHGRVEVVHKWHGKAASLLLFGLLVAEHFAAPAGWRLPVLVLIALQVVCSTIGYARDGMRQLRATGR